MILTWLLSFSFVRLMHVSLSSFFTFATCAALTCTNDMHVHAPSLSSFSAVYMCVSSRTIAPSSSFVHVSLLYKKSLCLDVLDSTPHASLPLSSMRLSIVKSSCFQNHGSAVVSRSAASTGAGAWWSVRLASAYLQLVGDGAQINCGAVGKHEIERRRKGETQDEETSARRRRALLRRALRLLPSLPPRNTSSPFPFNPHTHIHTNTQTHKYTNTNTDASMRMYVRTYVRSIVVLAPAHEERCHPRARRVARLHRRQRRQRPPLHRRRPLLRGCCCCVVMEGEWGDRSLQ